MKAKFFIIFFCLISSTSVLAQFTSEGCPTGQVKYYYDGDGDGFGTGTSQCYSSQPANHVMFGGDCNDSNPAIHPNTLWYADQDQDGLGDPSSTMKQCLKPLNYVSNKFDQCPTTYANTSTGCPATPVPSSPVFSDMNYIHTVTFNKAYTTAPSTLTINEAHEEVIYLDGLGRPLQHIKINQAYDGSTFEDLITKISYDSYGRSGNDYLPYAKAATSPGAYQPLDGTEVRDFYWQKFPGDFTTQTATNAYSEKLQESSPLSRVLKQAAPGSSWKMGSGHEIEFDYQANVSGSYSGKVRHFKVILSGGYSNPILSSPGFYAAGELYKNVTRDENHSSGLNHTTEEFTDKKGQVVLKRTYNNGISHDTYYVYDPYGNLTYVLPPLTNSTDALPPQTELDELSYLYKYDGRNRLVEKKIPGKGWEFIVYNNLDQPILTQDINLRPSGKWLYTKYDAFGRVISTGIFTYSTTRTNMQAIVNSYYNGSNKAWEDKTSTSTNDYYTNWSYPTSNTEVLTLNYYDNYTFNTTSQGLKLTSGSLILGTPVNYSVKGLLTGSRVKILDQATPQWITTLTHYDAKGRAIYTGSYNDLLLVKETTKNQFETITNNLLKSESFHQKQNLVGITEVHLFSYDPLNRLKKHTHSINGGPAELIAENSYDKIGQLIIKGVGNTSTSSTRIQTVNYNYNVRGWLMGINNQSGNNTTISTGSNDLFGFQINYDKPTDLTKALFNGNISQTHWRSKSLDQNQRSYLYIYDQLNRLTMAISNDGKFDVGTSTSPITYDKNGNIKNLYRKGAVVDSPVYSTTSHFGVMDNLTYTYDIGNKLLKVADAAVVDKYGFKDDALNTATDSGNDYDYDLNGNLTSDANKGILTGGIKYNHLNLPTEVKFNNSSSQLIKYTYDATGVKLRKEIPGKVTEYTGNFVYEKIGTGSNVLQFFNHPEGYVSYDSGQFNYVYNYKDHLGNVRLSYSDGNGNGIIETGSTYSEIIQEKNYYPFGLAHKGYNGGGSGLGNDAAKRYGFGGKELQDENISGSILDWYDVSARNYDPALGRWMNLDPLAEQMRIHSPYNYAFNNPLNFIDPDGMAPLWINNCDGTWTAENGDSAASLAEDAGISFNQANEIVRNQLGENYIDPNDGIEKSDVEVGDVVSISEQVEVYEAEQKAFQEESKIEAESKAASLKKVEELDKKIDSVSKEVTKFHKRAEIHKLMIDYDKYFRTVDKAQAGKSAGHSMLQSNNERDSVKSVMAKKELQKKQDSIKNSIGN